MWKERERKKNEIPLLYFLKPLKNLPRRPQELGRVDEK